MKKKLVSILLMIALVSSILFVLTGCGDSSNDEKESSKSSSPEEVVEEFINAYSDKKAKKMLDTIDGVGVSVLADLDQDEYEDFWDEYKEFLKSDEYDEVKEDWKETEEKLIDWLEDSFESSEDLKISVKSFRKTTEEGKNLYKVIARVKVEEDGEYETETITFYVMKDGSDYKIVGGDLIWKMMITRDVVSSRDIDY